MRGWTVPVSVRGLSRQPGEWDGAVFVQEDPRVSRQSLVASGK